LLKRLAQFVGRVDGAPVGYFTRPHRRRRDLSRNDLVLAQVQADGMADRQSGGQRFHGGAVFSSRRVKQAARPRSAGQRRGFLSCHAVGFALPRRAIRNIAGSWQTTCR
jgi:hypothetical protein